MRELIMKQIIKMFEDANEVVPIDWLEQRTDDELADILENQFLEAA